MSEKGSEIRSLQRIWEGLLPTQVITRTLEIDDYTKQLTPAELTSISKASDRRKFEFSTSRMAIRQLLKQEGHTSSGVISCPEGAPVWPADWVGSISHSRGICTVVLARNSYYSELGIDIENRNRLNQRIWRKIALAEEINEIEKALTHCPISMNDAMTVLFSVKEAYFKYQYPYTSEWLGFLDVQVHFLDNNQIRLTPVDKNYPHHDLINEAMLVYQLTDDHVLSAVYRRTQNQTDRF